jgi:hypothetical protein
MGRQALSERTVFVGEILKKVSGSCEFWGPRLETTFAHALRLAADVLRRPTLEDMYKILVRHDYREFLVGRCTDEEVAEFWKSEMAERLLGLDEFPILVDSVFRRIGEHVPLDTDIRGVAWALGRW